MSNKEAIQKSRPSWEPSPEVQAVFDALDAVPYSDKKGISQIVVRVIDLRTEAKRQREMEEAGEPGEE